jgi:hypothetical protein
MFLPIPSPSCLSPSIKFPLPRFAMMCRVIPAGRVSVENGKFREEVGRHRGKPDAASWHHSARQMGWSARCRTNWVRILRSEVSKSSRWHIESRIRNVTAPVKTKAEWLTYGLDFSGSGLGNSRYSHSIRRKLDRCCEILFSQPIPR